MQNKASLVGLTGGDANPLCPTKKRTNSAYVRIFSKGWNFFPACTGGLQPSWPAPWVLAEKILRTEGHCKLSRSSGSPSAISPCILWDYMYWEVSVSFLEASAACLSREMIFTTVLREIQAFRAKNLFYSIFSIFVGGYSTWPYFRYSHTHIW